MRILFTATLACSSVALADKPEWDNPAIHGNTVGVDHGQGLESMYLHMSRLAVKEGAVVRQGDVVGYAGSTGPCAKPPAKK